MNASSHRRRAVSQQGCASIASIELLENRVFLAAGDLDPTFGNGGTVNLTPIVTSTNFEDSQLTPDGKIVSISGGMLEERNLSGALESSFGSGGQAVPGIGALRLLVLGDGRILVGGTLDQDFAVSRHLANGQLDSSFGVDGVARLDLNNGSTDWASLLTVQPDGKILLAGTSGPDPAIVRFTADGQVDTSFDGDGILIRVFPHYNDVLTNTTAPNVPADILVQASGKIVLGGAGAYTTVDFSKEDYPYWYWMLRFNADGSEDSSFDPNDFSFSGHHSETQGPHFAAGRGDSFYLTYTQFNNSYFYGGPILEVLRHYNADGTLDASFGTNGQVIIADYGFNQGPPWNHARQVLPQEDGKVTVYLGGKDRLLKRYNADGSLDISFGADGTLLLAPLTPTYDLTRLPDADHVFQMPDGSYLASGRVKAQPSNTVSYYRQFMARYEPDGTFFAGFGNQGLVIAPAEPELLGQVQSLAGDRDGRILAAAWGSGRGGTQDLMVLRLNPDGTLDNSFDGNGLVGINFGGWDQPLQIIQQPDGKIVVVGYDRPAMSIFTDTLVIARLNLDGSLDTSFADGGKLRTTVTRQYDVINQVAVLPDGGVAVLVGGLPSSPQSNLSSSLWLYTPDGQLENEFGSAGQLTLPHGVAAAGVAAMADGTILVTGTVHGLYYDDPDYMHLYRYDTSGQLVSGFHSGYTGLELRAGAPIVQADGKFLCGRARFNADGSLDPTFGELGVNVYAVYDPMPDGKYLHNNGDVLMRDLANGEWDLTFGDHGRGPGTSVGGLIVVGDRIVSAGGDYSRTAIRAYQTRPPQQLPVIDVGPRLALSLVQINADPTYLLDAVTHQTKASWNFNPLNSSSPATLADLNGDGAPELIAADVQQGRVQIEVMDGQDYQPIGGPRGSWTPFPGPGAPSAIPTDPYYAQAYPGAINLASGDVNGDGVADIIAAVACVGPPHVKVFSGADGSLLWSFLAFAGPGGPADSSYFAQAFRGGVRVTSADINGDGYSDIITAAGPGAGPHVKVFSGRDLSVLASFWAFDPEFLGGVEIAAGDWNGDGQADVAAAAGPGVTPHVQVFDGRAQTRLASFFAYDQSFRGGVRLAMLDIDGDGQEELLSVPASDATAHVKAFHPGSGGAVDTVQSFFALHTVGAWSLAGGG